MSFEQWGYEFDGAYSAPDRLQAMAGVYVVWCKTNDVWKVIDVGQSDDVRQRLAQHGREGCWKGDCGLGTLYFAATYTKDLAEAERRCLEEMIRRLTNNLREAI